MVVFGYVPDNADDDGLLPYEDDDLGFPGPCVASFAILEEETTKMPITTTVGMT